MDDEIFFSISSRWLIIIIIVVGFIFLYLLYKALFSFKLTKENKKNELKINEFNLLIVKQEGLLREKELIIQGITTEMKGKAQDLAMVQFEQWKKAELDGYKKKADAAAEFTGKLLLQRWISENEERIRKDAANRSVRNVMGKVAEHLIPFSEAFNEFNPKDARFIGSPIDLIVFDGIEEKENEITIYFLEVKTGTSALSTRQNKEMEAVKAKRVEWRRLTIKDFGDGVNDLLSPNS